MSSQKNLKEYLRRYTVKLIKEAGSQIRKEEIKRQALTAKINLEYAENLREIIKEDYEKLMQPMDGIIKTIKRIGKGKEPIETVIKEVITDSVVNTIYFSLFNPFPRILEDINKANSFITQVMNNIIAELRKEGIQLPNIDPVYVSSQVPSAVANGLEEILNRLDMSIGILKGIIEASK